MSELDKTTVTESHPAIRPASSVHSSLSGLIFGGLCMIVVLAPLPLGSARPLAWDVLALAVALFLLATLLLPTLETSIEREGLFVPTVLFGIVIGVAILQVLPWIPGALHNPVWDQASDILGTGVNGSIAADRPAALIYILRLLSYAGIFYLAVITGRDQHRARLGVRIV